VENAGALTLSVARAPSRHLLVIAFMPKDKYAVDLGGLVLLIQLDQRALPGSEQAPAAPSVAKGLRWR